jgi:hypothetical protein
MPMKLTCAVRFGSSSAEAIVGLNVGGLPKLVLGQWTKFNKWVSAERGYRDRPQIAAHFSFIERSSHSRTR